MFVSNESRSQAIGVSISDCPDMAVYGLSNEHLIDAMTEIARHMLASGSRLVYGGDLRQHGFSELLFEIVARHGLYTDGDEVKVGVANYLAWPVHIGMPFEKIEQTSTELKGTAELVCLGLDGQPMAMKQRKLLDGRSPSEEEWTSGLTAMRQFLVKKTKARIVLGGRTESYKGLMPGIAEEALLSLEAKQPLYVIGGFGGCARDIAESLSLAEQQLPTCHAWPGRDSFNGLSAETLNNGLSPNENSILATTPHIDQAIGLILRGLSRVA
ncbi:MAG: hypothetical protein OXB95_06360 [Rhodobacteraceae bacterium]|nr:hypothetical protein [Paracoccaceae bacterium]